MNLSKSKEIYTDNTVMLYGRYKYIRLGNWPPGYLLKLYENEKHVDKPLKKYISDNLEAIKNRLHSNEPLFKQICEKIAYPNEAEAKFALKTITQTEQEHKKPVRAYECPKCNQWHLTSTAHHNLKK